MNRAAFWTPSPVFAETSKYGIPKAAAFSSPSAVDTAEARSLLFASSTHALMAPHAGESGELACNSTYKSGEVDRSRWECHKGGREEGTPGS